MYKLIFADDEKLVVNRIRQIVDWESSGFTLVGCCFNGYEVLEMVEKELPDVVILDINMPFISGLDAARQIKHSYPFIRIVFLTAYAEFEYAKQAVELNAIKYILKPVSKDDLEAVLDRIRASLDKERSKVHETANLARFHQQNREMLANDLLDGVTDGDAVYKRFQANGLGLNGSTFFEAAVFRVNDIRCESNWTGEDCKTMLYALDNIITELAQEKDIGLSCIRNEQVVLIAYSPSENGFEEQIQQFAESVLHLASTQLKFSATCGLGGVYRGCGKISDSYSEAVVTSKLSMRKSDGQLFTMHDLPGPGGDISKHTAVWNAVKYIESSYNNADLSADSVCEHLHLSPSYLRALFKRETGSTIIGYITKVRMERAKVLLKGGKLANSQIADEVGYANPHYFSYCFKRYFGISPNDMRVKI